MASEKAVGLVVRTWDWSETSRIAVLWTREFGKVRVLAKGGRRLKSNFESGLDLLSELTQELDPHPLIHDAALAILRDLGKPEVLTGPRLAAFELAFSRELG